MTDCPNAELRDRLPDFAHGQLGAAARAEVASHLAGCEACAAELVLLRELRAALRAAPSVDAARIVAALPAAPARAAGRSRGPYRAAWGRFDWRVAASVVAMVAAAGSAVVLGRPGGAERTGAAAQRAVAGGLSLDADLRDATTVELEALLADLDSFDGLPAGEPESTLPTAGDAGVEQ